MDIPERRLSPRAHRALVLIVAAMLVIAGASVAYLHPSLMRPPQFAPRAGAAGPAVLANDYEAAYSFLTESLGWALVVETTSATPCFSVFRTTDAARHWKRQFTRQLNVISLDPLQVRFFDRNRGVIAVGDPKLIYRTLDGGTHWALVRSPAAFHSSFVAADSLHAWLLGWSGPADQGAPSLFSTSDGGDTWSALGQTPAWSFSFWGGYANFVFRGQGEGWFGANAAAPTVYSSFDGGASWQPHSLPSSLSSNPCAGGNPTYVSLLPGHGVVVSSQNCGHQDGYASFDAGISWHPLASPPLPNAWSDVVYVDESHWWAMRFGSLWKSSDAGYSWNLVSQQNGTWFYLPHVVDANHAWAELFSNAPGQAPVSGLAVTSDGGLHWSQVSAPKPG